MQRKAHRTTGAAPEIRARIVVNDTGVLVNDEPVDVTGMPPMQWSGAGLYAARTIAQEHDRPIRALVVDADLRMFSLMVHPDGSTSGLPDPEPVRPRGTRRRHAASRRTRGASAVAIGSGALLLALATTVTLVVVGQADEPEASEQLTPTPPAVQPVSESAPPPPPAIQPGMQLEPAPVTVRARAEGTVAAVAVVVSADLDATVRWRLRGPDGELVADDRVDVGPGREVVLEVADLAPGSYRWSVEPTVAGDAAEGRVHVASPAPIAPPPAPSPSTPPSQPAPPPGSDGGGAIDGGLA